MLHRRESSKLKVKTDADMIFHNKLDDVDNGDGASIRRGVLLNIECLTLGRKSN